MTQKPHPGALRWTAELIEENAHDGDEALQVAAWLRSVARGSRAAVEADRQGRMPSDDELKAWGQEEEFFLFCAPDEFLDIVKSALIRYGSSQPAASAEPDEGPMISAKAAHAIVAGALYDFMGWLTSRRDQRLCLSSTDEAGPAVEAIKTFAVMRRLCLDDAAVLAWRESLDAAPVAASAEPPNLTDVEIEAYQRQQWRPIETAPDDGQHVLVRLADGTHCVGVMSALVELQLPPWHRRDTPTHWMPLPPAPEGS